ncbi:glycoside hydrolase family 3 protein [Ideonella sp.]|uniref:glycoside hydrolase family 3 protein n=1 Tax=Ideonella sp. TaxID=1929293 RepID=UPI003BB57B06
MNPLNSLRLAPYKLDDTALDWVAKTFAKLDLDAKLRQLFALAFIGDDLGYAHHIASFRPGAVVRAGGPDARIAAAATEAATSGSWIPALVAADIEGGVNHPASMPAAPNALSVAACEDPGLARQVYERLALEAKAHGFNWSLGPVLDLSANFRSAIVGTRSYGSDTARVTELATVYAQAMQANGVAASGKHWPGDGFDDRDQHLVTSVNPLSMDDWMATSGVAYRALIQAGVLTIMSAHIALPAFARECGAEGEELYRPASVSRHLNQTLLRERLGFNGLIVSDAAAMAGLNAWGGPASVVPDLIVNGCDVLLFSVDPQRDLELLHDAVQNGSLPLARVDEAVLRVLGLKASLGLHDNQTSPEPMAAPPARAHEKDAYSEVARRSITLVKDRRQLLPLTPNQHRRVLLLEQPPKAVLAGMPSPSMAPLVTALEHRGFEVCRTLGGMSLPVDGIDLILYVLTQESMLTVSEARIDWSALQGGFPASMDRPWQAVPTVMVSFGHPYHLFDAPRVPVYINAYMCSPEVQEAVVRKLTGEEPFLGASPVDPFCGTEQARY